MGITGSSHTAFHLLKEITMQEVSPTEGGKSLKSQKEQEFLFCLLHQSIVKKAGSERAQGTEFP